MASTDQYRKYWVEEILITPEAFSAFERELHLYAKRTPGTKSKSAAKIQEALFYEASLRQSEGDAKDLKLLMEGRWSALKKAVREISTSFFEFYPQKAPGGYFATLSKEDRLRISNAISDLSEYRVGGVTTKMYTRWLWDNRMKTIRGAQPKQGEQSNPERSDMPGQFNLGLHPHIVDQRVPQTTRWELDMQGDFILPPLQRLLSEIES
ncbi:hypothetical protein TWF281_002738 [Arthrobotrys megalospora]